MSTIDRENQPPQDAMPATPAGAFNQANAKDAQSVDESLQNPSPSSLKEAKAQGKVQSNNLEKLTALLGRGTEELFKNLAKSKKALASLIKSSVTPQKKESLVTSSATRKEVVNKPQMRPQNPFKELDSAIGQAMANPEKRKDLPELFERAKVMGHLEELGHLFEKAPNEVRALFYSHMISSHTDSLYTLGKLCAKYGKDPEFQKTLGMADAEPDLKALLQCASKSPITTATTLSRVMEAVKVVKTRLQNTEKDFSLSDAELVRICFRAEMALQNPTSHTYLRDTAEAPRSIVLDRANNRFFVVAGPGSTFSAKGTNSTYCNAVSSDPKDTTEVVFKEAKKLSLRVLHYEREFTPPIALSGMKAEDQQNLQAKDADQKVAVVMIVPKYNAGNLAKAASTLAADSRQILSAFSQLVDQVNVLHSRKSETADSIGIAHKDIKPGNVLVTNDAGGKIAVRLSDFDTTYDPATEPNPISNAKGFYSTPEFTSMRRIRELRERTNANTLLDLYTEPHPQLVGPELEHDSYATIATLHAMLYPNTPFPWAAKMQELQREIRMMLPKKDEDKAAYFAMIMPLFDAVATLFTQELQRLQQEAQTTQDPIRKALLECCIDGMNPDYTPPLTIASIKQRLAQFE